jgi:glyoxylase-like metal-dependent hydrolase (beta-lactamase superfamily II)
VKEGDIIDLGELKFTVIETPGHTKCSISLYSSREQLLVSSESLGLYTGHADIVIPCFLVGYAMSVESVKKVMALPIKSILFPHMGLHSGVEIEGFFEKSLFWFEKTKNAVLDAYAAGKRDGELIDVLADMFYTDEAAKVQPKKAFLLNSGYMIQMLVRECLGIEDFEMSHNV